MKKQKIMALCMTAVMTASLGMTGMAAELPEGYEVLNGYNPADFVSEKDPSEFKMAVIVKGVAEWFSRLEEGVLQFADEYGVDATVQFPATTDAASQLEIIDSLLTQDYDAIIVVPNDATALEESFANALDNGVVVIGHEASNLTNCLYDTEAFNTEQYAQALAEGLIEATGGSGTYAIMVGYTTSITHMEYANAEVEYLKENCPDLVLLNDEIPTCESQESTTTAYEQAKQILKSNPDLNGFICHCSTDAGGIAQAVVEMGLQDQVKIIGSGVPSSYADELKDGTIYSVTTWDPALSGYVACLTAYNVLTGVPVGQGSDLSADGVAPGYESVNLVVGANNCLIGNAPCIGTAENVDELF
ncbi:MAG: substrate-binding domain-containing protein [Lachnospiraceae bacterium]|nr:substrate-binding domain-containing protein [Lachnospiraceae bacterium]